MFDKDFLSQKEERIRRGFVPRSWSDIAAQMTATVQLWAEQHDNTEASAAPAPLATLGAYHPIVRNFETRIWRGMRSAEIFRSGSGWWGPDNWGCWTKAMGATLEIGVPSAVDEPLRLYVQLHGFPRGECPWTVSLTDGRSQKGVLPPGAFKWIHFDIDTIPQDHVVRLTVEGTTSFDLRTVTEDGDPRVVSTGVAGFFLCHASDMEARAALLEAVALGNLSELAFNREADDDGAIVENPVPTHADA